jgi:hypothetical protein
MVLMLTNAGQYSLKGAPSGAAWMMRREAVLCCTSVPMVMSSMRSPGKPYSPSTLK